MSSPAVVNLAQKFGLFAEHWTPKIVAETNGQLVKIAKFQGEFVWHAHLHEDELFLVVKGAIDIWIRDGDQERCEHLDEGDLLIVPKGVEHKPVAAAEAHVLVVEPASTKHTGETKMAGTIAVADQQWL